MSTNEPKLFDGKMILAIGLTMIFWVGYQSYLQNKYPDAYKDKQQTVAEETSGTAVVDNGEILDTTSSNVNDGVTLKAEEGLVPKETFIDFSDDNFDLQFSSRGMSVSKIKLNKFSDREGIPIEFQSTDSALHFETTIVGRRNPLYFTMKRTEDNQIYGEAQIGNMIIKKTINIDSSSYLLTTNVTVENADDNFSGLITKLTSPVQEADGASFLSPGLNYQEYYVNYDEGTEDRLVLEPGSSEKETFSTVSLASLSSQYFTVAMLNNSDILPDFQGTASVRGTKTDAVGVMTHMMLNRGSDFTVSYKAYAGPKSWEVLESVNPILGNIINFGFFKTIAHWIFELLRIIHAAVGNWGVAIILLTLLVRVIVMPFNIMSYKSMKAMSKIQPQMKAIRDKYKNDPQKANQEIMALMKEAKANPLGGCLPMLLQIPVFFALYQVLGQSIELYKAPFGLWISDLSSADPFYIFPVGMGLAMYFQQKITPSTLEPAQQKMLMFMPIFLIAIMATLPSGLTLYMFISTLFGVLQQLYFMKDDRKREELATA